MHVSSLSRPDPEKVLRQVQAEESKQFGAKLKIFLGYAPGVGKSYRMLDEARRRFERGEDVVIAAIQGKQAGTHSAEGRTR
jgi:two-component system, OmpR family, sensor histidine kinase KdpD